MEVSLDLREVDIRYAKLIKDCLEYILKVKRDNNDSEIVDIIVDFCFKNDINPEEMGDAISQDEYFKQLIKVNGDITNKENSALDLDDW